jgi:hypothetical protein
MPFSCAFTGQCEFDIWGKYETLGSCRLACQSADAKELLYEINSMDLGSTSKLAPSDQVEIIQRLWGFRPTPEDAQTIILGLYQNDYHTIVTLLPQYPLLEDVLKG